MCSPHISLSRWIFSLTLHISGKEADFFMLPLNPSSYSLHYLIASQLISQPLIY